MRKESILYGVIGVLAGSLATIIIASTAVNADNAGTMGLMGMHTSNSQTSMMNDSSTNNSSSGMGMSMSDMNSNLKGKTGDDFDKAFLTEMIDHHQGAIDMANLAKQNAKHDEIKNLANDIVTAQTKEIAEMKDWQKSWGY
jgi:uncharacterized protein (DUF305 family)